jgi:hypothetical protein
MSSGLMSYSTFQPTALHPQASSDGLRLFRLQLNLRFVVIKSDHDHRRNQQ